MNYCPQCGSKLELGLVNGNEINHCKSCGFIDWNNWIYVACCVVAFDELGRVLLIRLRENNTLTFPGGFRNIGESLEDAANREFYEETGGMIIDDLKLHQIYTKDEQRLLWVVYTAKIKSGYFKENDEAIEMIMVHKNDHFDESEFRGKLTFKVFNELKNIKTNI